MDFYRICLDAYRDGHYDNRKVGIFVEKGKITAAQYKEITNQEYVA